MPDTTHLPNALALGLTALATGVLSGSALLAYSVFMPRCQFWAPVIRSIPDRETYTLTFDDGPHPDFTPKILDILREHQAPATFFVIGRLAEKHPDLLQRIVREGHALGNHSLDHDRFGVNQKRPYWQHQINETQAIITNITGRPPVLFRSPMGFKTGHIARAARDAKLPFVGWSVRSLDTRPRSARQIADRVIERTTGHDIILLHDGVDPHRKENRSQQATVDALPAILAGLANKRLRPISLLDALLKAQVETPHLAKARA